MKNRIAALRKRHRDTLRQIFTRPVPTDLKWQRVEALIIALGGGRSRGSGFPRQISTKWLTGPVSSPASVTGHG